MGQVFSKLQNVRVRVAYTVAKVFGYTILFTHRGGTQYTLYARFVDSGSEELEVGGRLAEYRYIDLALPIQTNFPDLGSTDDEAVIQGDLVVHRNRGYQVKGEVKRDDKDRTYHFRVYEQKALSNAMTSK